MTHSFKLKKSVIRGALEKNLGIKNVYIDNKTDVFNTINIALNFIELENFLQLSNCSYNFVSSQLLFRLELDKSKSKSDFFESITKFEKFLEN